MTRSIIGLSGPIGCGKTTAARVLEEMGYKRVRFAGPLKAMTHAIGLTPEHTDGALKEVPCDLIGGRTPRFFMQRLGTEFGRQMIADDLWIRAWKSAVASLPEDVPVVADDVRFANEAKVVRELGGVVVKIDRDGYAGGGDHSSEQFDFSPDYLIANHDRDVFEDNIRQLGHMCSELHSRDAA